MIKILIVTLFSGENEFEECVDSVKGQEHLYVEHVIIENLPKREAHQKLFQIFEERKSAFDYLAKLDADMKFSECDALYSIIKGIPEGVDAYSCTVFDYITNDYMQSFNVFSSRCKFYPLSNHELFTDKIRVDFPGTRLFLTDDRKRVLHAFAPSDFQAFVFGIHRAIKVMQYGSLVPRMGNSFMQKKVLYKTYINGVYNGNRPACYAAVGATLVFSGAIDDGSLRRKSDYEQLFESVDVSQISSCHKTLRSDSLGSLFFLLGPFRFTLGAVFVIFARLKGVLVKSD